MCRHSGYLELQRIPALPLPPDLRRLLPSLPLVARHVPAATVLAALPLVANWLEQIPHAIPSSPFCITPPFPVGDLWTCFLLCHYTSCWTDSHPPSSQPPLYYWRHPSTGSPWTVGPDMRVVPIVCSACCSACGRPAPHAAAVHLPTCTVQCLPHFFCVHPRRHPPFCTRALAPRCSLTFHGLRLDGAVPVHVLPWSSLCTPQLPQILLPPPPYLRPPPPPRPRQTSSSPQR